MSKQFTKKELLEIFQAKEIDGKISMEDVANIVFDNKFPQELYEDAKNELISYSNDLERFKELSAALLPHWQELIKLQTEIIELGKSSEANFEQMFIKRVRVREIENEIRHSEAEFDMLNKRIEERKGK